MLKVYNIKDFLALKNTKFKKALNVTRALNVKKL